MTTIATDGKSMAGDGVCSGNGIRHGLSVRKVHLLPDGRIVGIAGCSYAHAAFLPWLTAGGENRTFPTISRPWCFIRAADASRIITSVWQWTRKSPR